MEHVRKTPLMQGKTAPVEEAAEHRANARLFAAAPDLLEALKAFVDAEESWAKFGRPGIKSENFAPDDMLSEAAKLARAAIAKAAQP